MRLTARLAPLLCALTLPLAGPAPAAPPQTVCTITVNSADEKEAFRRHLPPAKYRFVELVERNRPDWLRSACQASISCDVLVVSGHFDGSTEFFSDVLDSHDVLPVAELERVSCSDSCPGLFDQLKEVYLFGCNTLNSQAQRQSAAEWVRRLVRDGVSRQQGDKLLRELAAPQGDSSRDRMRMIFADVPVIYGFSAVAPLGPTAGAVIDRYLQAGGSSEFGQGRTSGRLLAHFAPFGLAAAPGVTARDALAATRQDLCHLADERHTDAQKLRYVHQLLQRPTLQSRLFLDRIGQFAASLDAQDRRQSELQQALDAIRRDTPSRERFLALVHASPPAEPRAQLVQLALDLGWLTREQRVQELDTLAAELLARDALDHADVDLLCRLNAGHELDGGRAAATPPAGWPDTVAHAAGRACLGDSAARPRTLQALHGTREAELLVAQAYLRHRPPTAAAELRSLAEGITRMPAGDAQVSALDALGRLYVKEPGVFDPLLQLYVRTPSAAVQSAIAGLLIRADRRALPQAELLRTLQGHRLPSPDGHSFVDVLIHLLHAPS